MADGLLDLGGGQKMVNASAMVPKDTGLQDTLGLVNLIQQVQTAPLQRRKLEVETALKTNELLNIDVQNLLQRANLEKAIGDEQRARSRFVMETFKELPELFRIDPNIGTMALQQLVPDAQATPNGDGTMTVEIPSKRVEVVDGQPQEVPTRERISFSIDPNKMKPEDKRNLEGQWYDRFQRNPSVQSFAEVYNFYKNMKSAAQQATGAGDVSLLYSFMKMNDPRSTVREGEKASAEQTVNIPQSLVNMYNKAILSDAPVFGEPGSKARANFLRVGEAFYKNRREDTLMIGRDIADFAKRENLSPQNILAPVGDITDNEFMMTPQEVLGGIRNKLGGKP